MKPDQSSKHLQGIVDVTLLAPIRPGLIDALDTRTYTTRLKLLLRTLNSLRSATRELAAFRPFSDGAERIRTIHSFRLAILEPEQKLLLAVTFDRAWEPYVRIIWRDVGTLLDVIFCNCVGYVSAHHHGVAEYFEWVRKAQVEAQFFYNASSLTVDDLQYLRKTERLHRDVPRAPQAGDPSANPELDALELVIDDPEEVAWKTAQAHLAPAGAPPGPETTQTTGLRALAALYRLTDLYPADRGDGEYLLRATHEILKEFRELDTQLLFPAGTNERDRFKSQLEWFERPVQARSRVARQKSAALPQDIQGGILTGYADVTHGCLVLISVVDPDKARAFLALLPVTTELSAQAGGPYCNIGVTFQGLRRLGVPVQDLDRLPKEFREGMEARAGLLGDFRTNHPRNWALPERNWPQGNAAGKIAARVQMTEVDIVIQFRLASPLVGDDHRIVGNPAHPLHGKVAALDDPKLGMAVLSVEAMRRYIVPNEPYAREHFGFADGISQPAIGLDPEQVEWSNITPEGELFHGYVNANGDRPVCDPLLVNGTFLVIRKLRQDIPALNGVLDKHKAQMLPDDLKARMVGRTLDGEALAKPGMPPDNDFNYEADSSGALCPFQAHIRRVNPRTPRKTDRLSQPTVPRIMRRGLSYGPQFNGTNPDDERGLIFMAYNASIAEQFEVVQRWLSGGNSTGTYSEQGDPLLGVPLEGDPRTFRFQHDGKMVRVELGADPFVVLEWGAYLFVPSPAALQLIAKLHNPVVSPEAAAGEKIVQQLLALEASGTPKGEVIAGWKACLEDIDARLSGDNAAVWAAIRENHDGVLRSAYGVLVAGKDLVMKVFRNVDEYYSVRGYHERMEKSIGGNYLGLDYGDAYERQSKLANQAIQSVTERAAFDKARDLAKKQLGAWLGVGNNKATFDVRELSDEVLADLAKFWFDIPDGRYIRRGGWDWVPAPQRVPEGPRCPGDFTSPSRYLFSPDPGAAAAEYGQVHGRTLLEAMTTFVKFRRTAGSPVLTGALSKAMFAAISDNDQLARTLVGALMGFLPTVDGNLRSVLYEWVDDKTLWRVQEALLSCPNQATDPYAAADKVLREPLMRTMQLRPVPDLVWRTAVKDHHLGREAIAIDDRIVVGIVSATQEDLARNAPADVYPVFGGNRNATTGAIPTHACPAYAMAMGVLLGTISGLLEKGTLHPTPSPTGLTLKS